jgi:GNAT superfamily N-acetyltransferase
MKNDIIANKHAQLLVRRAKRQDVMRIVELLADDSLGSVREHVSDPPLQSYLDAFDAIEADPNNELVVACVGEKIIGTLQIMFIPYLTYRGSWRALIEGVRIDARFRGRGFGRALLEWACRQARGQNCQMVQLTTNKVRLEAKRFYEGLNGGSAYAGAFRAGE